MVIDAVVQLNELMFIPKWLGLPMYPGGFPVPQRSFSVQTGEAPLSIEERIQQYYQVCINDQGELLENPPLSEDDFEVLRQWVIYYLHAPIFLQTDWPEFEALKAKSFTVSSWWELGELCMDALDFGLDILS